MSAHPIPVTLAPDWLAAPTAIHCQREMCPHFATAKVHWLMPPHETSPPKTITTFMCEEHLNQYLNSQITVHQLIPTTQL